MHVAERSTEVTVTEPSSLERVVELLEPDDFEQPLRLVLQSAVQVTYSHGIVHYSEHGGYWLEGWFECEGIQRPCRLHQPADGPLMLRYHELFPG